jgi:hypothetical protein
MNVFDGEDEYNNDHVSMKPIRPSMAIGHGERIVTNARTLYFMGELNNK